MISLFKKSRIKEHNVVDIRNMSEFDYTEIVDKKINIVLGQPATGKTTTILQQCRSKWKDQKVMFIGSDSKMYTALANEILKELKEIETNKIIQVDPAICNAVDHDFNGDYDLVIIDEPNMYKGKLDRCIKKNITTIVLTHSLSYNHFKSDIKFL